MKKTFSLFFFLSVFIYMAQAEDKIITVHGDTIPCRIVSMTDSHIVYEQVNKSQQLIGKVIPFHDVAEYFRDSTARLHSPRSQRPKRPWSLSLSAGGTHLPWILDNIIDVVPTENTKMKNGFSLNASAHYFILQALGVGVRYAFLTSGIESDELLNISELYPMYTQFHSRERQYINYTGLSVASRQHLDRKHKFTLAETLSGGLHFYRLESQYQYFLNKMYAENILITGIGFGATLGVSVDYQLLPYLSLGVEGEFMYAALSKVQSRFVRSDGGHGIDTGELISPLNLSHINYSLVVRFHL